MWGNFLRCSLKENWIVILLIWERVNDEECRLLRCSRKLHKAHVIVLPAPTGGVTLQRDQARDRQGVLNSSGSSWSEFAKCQFQKPQPSAIETGLKSKQLFFWQNCIALWDFLWMLGWLHFDAIGSANENSGMDWKLVCRFWNWSNR